MSFEGKLIKELIIKATPDAISQPMVTPVASEADDLWAASSVVVRTAEFVSLLCLLEAASGVPFAYGQAVHESSHGERQ